MATKDELLTGKKKWVDFVANVEMTRDQARRPSDQIEHHYDLQYGPDSKYNFLDVYLDPKQKKQKLPVIIYAHGGGWTGGDKKFRLYYGEYFAKQGFAFVNINYRLGGSAEYPAQLEDLNRSVHWVADNADHYPFDLNNVFLMGDSSGGHMVTQYITILTNPDYRKLFGFAPAKMHFRAAVLNSAANFMMDDGVLSGEVGSNYEKPIHDMFVQTELYFTKEVRTKHPNMLASEKYITKDFLPVFIDTGNKDFLHDMSVKLDGYLTALKVEHEYKSYGNEAHPEEHIFVFDLSDKYAQQANQAALKFIKKHIVK